MNTEQLTRPDKLNVILTTIKFQHIVELWDYSIENVKILEKHNISARHVPLDSPEWYIEKLRKFREPYLNNFVYQVGFCGAITERRSIIFDKLKENGISINLIRGPTGDARDMELAKCAILINVHAGNDYNVFESARCESWLKFGVPVISENSLDNDLRCINVDYNELVQTVTYYFGKNT